MAARGSISSAAASAARFTKALGINLNIALGADSTESSQVDLLIGKELKMARGAVILDEVIGEGACADNRGFA
jgi:hypothetical protein